MSIVTSSNIPVVCVHLLTAVAAIPAVDGAVSQISQRFFALFNCKTRKKETHFDPEDRPLPWMLDRGTDPDPRVGDSPFYPSWPLKEVLCAPLSNGRAVTLSQKANSWDLFGQLLNQQDEVVAQFRVRAQTASLARAILNPQVTPLRKGFIVTWTDFNREQERSWAQVYNENGHEESGPLLTSNPTHI